MSTITTMMRGASIVGVVTGAMIQAGAITDAKVAAGAAIAGSKLAAPAANLATVQLASATLAAPAANIDITGIPAGYSALRLTALLRGDAVAATITTLLRLNGDATAIYDGELITALQNVSPLSGQQILAGTSIQIGGVPAASSQAAEFGIVVVDIPFYASTVARKLLSTRSGFVDTTGSFSRSEANTGHWRNTAAITQVTLIPSSGNWVTGSQMVLHGIF